MASRRFGRYLKWTHAAASGSIPAKVAAEAKYDGQFVVTTNDDTLDAEDVALGYTSMMLIEGCFRRMKTTGLQTRPIYHWRPSDHRRHEACVLALLLERAAEIRCQQPWRTIRQTLDQFKVVRYQMQGKTIAKYPGDHRDGRASSKSRHSRAEAVESVRIGKRHLPVIDAYTPDLLRVLLIG